MHYIALYICEVFQMISKLELMVARTNANAFVCRLLIIKWTTSGNEILHRHETLLLGIVWMPIMISVNFSFGDSAIDFSCPHFELWYDYIRMMCVPRNSTQMIPHPQTLTADYYTYICNTYPIHRYTQLDQSTLTANRTCMKTKFKGTRRPGAFLWLICFRPAITYV